MAWTKAKTAAVIGVGILFATGTTMITVKTVQHHREGLVWDHITRRDRQQLENAPPASSIRATKFAPEMTGEMETRGKVLGLHRPFDAILSRAYDVMPCRIIALAPLPSGNFDFIISGPNPPRNALALAIKEEFGLSGKLESRETDVLTLTVNRRNAPGLIPTFTPGASSLEDGHLTHSGASMTQLAQLLEHYLGTPVIDQTGLSDRYVIDLKWPQTGEGSVPNIHGRTTNPEGLKQALLIQLGLQLVPDRKVVEMLIVEKAP